MKPELIVLLILVVGGLLGLSISIKAEHVKLDKEWRLNTSTDLAVQKETVDAVRRLGNTNYENSVILKDKANEQDGRITVLEEKVGQLETKESGNVGNVVQQIVYPATSYCVSEQIEGDNGYLLRCKDYPKVGK